MEVAMTVNCRVFRVVAVAGGKEMLRNATLTL